MPLLGDQLTPFGIVKGVWRRRGRGRRSGGGLGTRRERGRGRTRDASFKTRAILSDLFGQLSRSRHDGYSIGMSEAGYILVALLSV